METADIIQDTETPLPQETQTKSNHARFDPGFHFSLVPAAFVVFIASLVKCYRHFDGTGILLVGMAALFVAVLLRMRSYSLKVQDRVIRLEERLRLQALLPQTMYGVIPTLTVSQLVALRFASDAEMPSLAERAAKENLTSKQIKEAIQSWRPDYFRV